MAKKAVHPVTQYALDVIAGREVACKKVRQACQRHLDDLKRKDLIFDEKEATRVIRFAENLKHVKGKWDTDYIVLELWQKFVLGSLFGWKVKATGRRRFRMAYIQIARKNAKTTLGAAIALYALVADGEPGAEIYSAATKRDQAKILFEVAKSQARKFPALNKRLGIFKLNIHDLQTASKFEPLGADANTLDGLNTHCAIVDELHAHKDSKVWDVLDTSTGARLQPLIIAITTAGFERSVCIDKYNYCEQVLDAVLEDDSTFAFIAEIDEGDDWTDPKVWKKANPNLGISVFQEQLESLCKRAKAIPAEQNNFLCKHLNKWVNQSTRWISMDDWNACAGEVSEDELKGRICFGGLDLSATTDLTAFVLLFPPEEAGEIWKALYRFWVPGGRIEQRTKGYLVDKVPFEAWEREGIIRRTEGNVVDYDFIRRDILADAEKFDIQEIAYDPYRAMETAIKLQEEGMKMVQFRQGPISFTAPMERFYGLLLDRKFCHGNNPAMTWMANNVVVRHDANLNMAPDKKSAKDRIDGPVALFMALGRAIVVEAEGQSVYESEGIFTI